ncbi:TetR/AcrR family transcriptional regulator [Frondihabitans cladoniiphilus]|uniref:TetR/AcrR family transcriptional regulator n=1 Tax=Frondihabitans cladoniiphilus TaxID=715785 RepID=A0ABP8VUD9_9MICO
MDDTKITARGRATRQRIIEATGEQILASGIGGTTLDTVRAATLTSKSQLFHYFPGGKTELVREVALWEGQQLLAAQEPEIHDLSTYESWERWRAGLVDYYIGLGRWACPIGSLATQAAMLDPELEATIAASMRQWRDALASGIERMRASGLVDPAADARKLAVSILAAIQGGLVLSQPERAAWPLEAALDTVLDALHRVALPSSASSLPR